VVQDAADIVPLNLSLDDLQDGDCTWPYDASGRIEPLARFCGHPALFEKPYCPGHAQISSAGIPTRKNVKPTAFGQSRGGVFGRVACMIGLTRKQAELFRFIKARIDATGVPPSFEEMKDAVNLRSKSGVARLIVGLEERGVIRRMPHRARAIEIASSVPDGSIKIEEPALQRLKDYAGKYQVSLDRAANHLLSAILEQAA
jgi:hypothetical protein